MIYIFSVFIIAVFRNHIIKPNLQHIVIFPVSQENSGNSPAAANGLFMMVSFLIRSITIVLVGLIGDVVGLESMFMISALAGFGAIPFLMMLKEPDLH